MTSSVAAIAYGRGRGVHTFTEADWPPDYPGATPYIRSKSRSPNALRATGWRMRALPSSSAPSIPPSCSVWCGARTIRLRSQWSSKLLDGTLRGCPDVGFGVVDVPTVAEMHVRALTAPDMAGERFIASGPFLKMIQIAHILEEQLGDDARNVPTRTQPDLLVRIAALFDPLVKAVVGELGSVRNMDASHARSVLGWVARPAQESIVDTARSLIELGIVKA